MKDPIADAALLSLLSGGPHIMPLFSEAEDNNATIHAESMVERGLVGRMKPKAGEGTTYFITALGRDELKALKSD